MKAVVIPLMITIITVIIFFVSLPTLVDNAPNSETHSAEVTEFVNERGETIG